MADLTSILLRIIYYALLLGGLLFLLVLLYRLIFQKKTELQQAEDWVTLAVEVPRENEKSPLAAEQLFAALHGILKTEEEYSDVNKTVEYDPKPWNYDYPEDKEEVNELLEKNNLEYLEYLKQIEQITSEDETVEITMYLLRK